MVIDLIFTGLLAEVNINFISFLMDGKNDSYFLEPEDTKGENFEEVVSVFESHHCCHFTIHNSQLKMNNKLVRYVFIDITLNESALSLLLYFDLVDFMEGEYKAALNTLKIWCEEEVIKVFRFSNFECRMGDGNEDEYYFDRKGLGPLYDNPIYP